VQSCTLVMALLAGCGGSEPATVYPSIAAAAEELADELTTGTLLFSEGDCLAVRVYTSSPFTHVSLVVRTDAGVQVYDSTSGIGVRKLPLAEYLAAQAPQVMHVHRPLHAVTADQSATLIAYLDSQLGRPYAIDHHLSGERCEGLHCAEYATDALMSIGVMQAERPAKVSPASLREGITRFAVYDAGHTVELPANMEPPVVADNACHQMWLDTCACCSSCCDQLSAWFLCE
jgi:hypothetical protein